MKHGFMLLTMACAVATAFAAGQDDEKKHKPAASLSPPEEFSINPSTSTSTSTANMTNSTTAAPTPKPTTPTNSSTTTTTPPKPTTPTNSSTTTTTPPKPTTQNTNSTTHSGTTTIPKTSNTTAAPTTHNGTNQTTVAPTTPPQPTPKANLTVGEYILKEGSKVCAMASMALQIRVEYNTKNKSEGTFIVQRNISDVNGFCYNSITTFNIIFKEGSINLKFQKNTTEKSVYVSSVAVELTYPFNHEDPKANYSASNSSVQLFRAAIGHSYSCKSQLLYLGQGIHLDITQVRMQAYNITNGFGLPDICPADQPDYRVAIAVGIVLLILIVIVVVAYLIGRRRRIDGYQSL